ncbi:hypothetical protein ACOME3_006517 [Neoechinorhynchus agilis]
MRADSEESQNELSSVVDDIQRRLSMLSEKMSTNRVFVSPKSASPFLIRQRSISLMRKDRLIKTVVSTDIVTGSTMRNVSRNETMEREDSDPLLNPTILSLWDCLGKNKVDQNLEQFSNIEPTIPANSAHRKSISRSHTFSGCVGEKEEQNKDPSTVASDNNIQTAYSDFCAIEHPTENAEMNELASLETKPTDDERNGIIERKDHLLSTVDVAVLTPALKVNEGLRPMQEHIKRRAIVLELYEAEKSYVDSLSALVMKYYLPLKEKHLISLQNLNDIFYKIPEIHVHHQLFLFSYKKKIERWNDKETIGEIIFNTFTKSSLLETYVGFIGNFLRSQEVLKTCKEIPAFAKFLENQAKDNERKLALMDLLIQPVQRIPRYELFLKDLIKHTAQSHADAPLLRDALEGIHSLAVNIDEAKDANATLEPEVSLDEVIAGIDLEPYGGVSYNMTAKVTYSINGEKRREGSLFIIGQYIVLTSRKRRTGLLSRKPSMSARQPESCDMQFGKREHNLRLKEKIDDVQYEVMNTTAYQSLLSKYHCISDNAILHQVEELLLRLNTPCDELVKEVRSLKNRNESVVKGEVKAEAIRDAIVRLDLTIKQTQKVCLWFNSPEERLAWLNAISEMKAAHSCQPKQLNYMAARLFSFATDMNKHKSTVSLSVERSEDQWRRSSLRPDLHESIGVLPLKYEIGFREFFRLGGDDMHAGGIFDRYTKKKDLGSGTFGRVYLVQQAKSCCWFNRKLYAMKVEEKGIKYPQLRTEYELLSRLRHPVFPQVIEWIETPKKVAMVMELLGPNLNQLFIYLGRQFSLKTTYVLLIQMLDCLQCLNQHRLVHRDIKPHNFVMGLGPSAHLLRIIDMGFVSRVTSADGLVGRKSFFIGTPSYASIRMLAERRVSYIDDVESCLYVATELMHRTLPWNSFENPDNKDRRVYHKMVKDSKIEFWNKADDIGIDPGLLNIYKAIKNYSTDKCPLYSQYRSILIDRIKEERENVDYQYDWCT